MHSAGDPLAVKIGWCALPDGWAWSRRSANAGALSGCEKTPDPFSPLLSIAVLSVEIPPNPSHLHKDKFLQKRLDNDPYLSYCSYLGNIDLDQI